MTAQNTIRSIFEQAGGKRYALDIQKAKHDAARFFLDLLKSVPAVQE